MAKVSIQKNESGHLQFFRTEVKDVILLQLLICAFSKTQDVKSLQTFPTNILLLTIVPWSADL